MPRTLSSPKHISGIEWSASEKLVLYPDAVSEMETHIQAMQDGDAPEKIWLLEHPPVYTAGTSAKPEDLLEQNQFPVYASGRGGQLTYHGPGQRIAYVMLDLKKRAHPKQPDLRQYVKQLEAWIINSLRHFDVESFIRDGRVGVWTYNQQGAECKIAAIGIRVRKWISYHGISLNVCPDLSHYRGIIPCGIQEYGITSLADLGIKASMADVDAVLKETFEQQFAPEHLPRQQI